MCSYFWVYCITCYALMGFFLSITKGKAVDRISEKRDKSKLFISNYLFFLSPLIIALFIVRIVITLILPLNNPPFYHIILYITIIVIFIYLKYCIMFKPKEDDLFSISFSCNPFCHLLSSKYLKVFKFLS